MNHTEAERLRSDPQHWTLGIFYACREDPRIVVKNRLGLG